MIAYYQDTHDRALRRCVALMLVNKSEALGQLGSFEEAVAVFDELVAGFADDSIEAFDEAAANGGSVPAAAVAAGASAVEWRQRQAGLAVRRRC